MITGPDKKFSDVVRGNVIELIQNVMSITEARSMQCRRNINGNFECCDVPLRFATSQNKHTNTDRLVDWQNHSVL